MRPPQSLPRDLSFAVLLLLFFGSGCAALIYEVVWFQMIELVVGSSAVSMAVLLGTFMGGMAAGNLALPKWVSEDVHPLRVYAVLEFGIAASAAVVWFGLPVAADLYAASAQPGSVDYWWRGVLCVVFLLPPTMCMGATLPAAARWTEMTRQGTARLGACYGINIVGAVVGALVAGFFLLRLYDGAVATAGAVGLNLAIALVALGLARRHPRSTHALRRVDVEKQPPVFRGRRRVWIVTAFSGFCSLVAQVVWTRLLSLTLGGTVYNFSIILSVFLTGLGIGALVGAYLAKRSSQPQSALGVCQLLQVFTVVWGMDLLTQTIPFWGDSAAATVWAQLLTDFFRTSLAVLPATVVWGASLPLALAAASGAFKDPGRSVASIYFVNTIGAVIGAVLASLVLLPQLGTSRSESLLIALSLAGAFLLLRPRTWIGRSLLGAAAIIAGLLVLKPSTVPWQVVAYGRHAAKGDQTARMLYLGEGSQATVAVSQNMLGVRYFHVSGKTEASTHFYDMRLQRMLGHLPALVHPQPKSVLVVGLGAGVTAGSFVTHPSVERIVICEIEPLIVNHVARFFAEQNHRVLDDPRVEVVFDDARHYLATTRETFDIITSDPIHPWVKGAAKLYSEEYFRLCRQHLNPGGLVTQWVPFYSSSRDVVRSEIGTFFSVFPGGTIWGNEEGGRGYDSVLMGSSEKLSIDVNTLRTRLGQLDHDKVRESLEEVHLGSAVSLLSTYAGRQHELQAWLEGAEINRDSSLRLQYLAGLSVQSREGAAAYKEMLAFRSVTPDLFRGTEADLNRIVNRATKVGEER